MCRQRFVAACSWPWALHSRPPLSLSAAFCARMMDLSFRLPRARGGRSAGRRALVFSSRLRGATAALAKRGASRCDRDGAPRRSTVAIFGRATTRHVSDSAAGPCRDFPTARPQGQSRSGPATSRPRLHRSPGTPRPRSACRIVSGDAPPERGCELYSMATICSQQCSCYVVKSAEFGRFGHSPLSETPQPTLAEPRTLHSADGRTIHPLPRPGRDGTPPGNPQARR